MHESVKRITAFRRYQVFTTGCRTSGSDTP